MGDMWHWLWFILLLIASGERNDFESNIVDRDKTIIIRNAERTEMQLHIAQLEEIQKISVNTIELLNKELEYARQREEVDILEKF